MKQCQAINTCHENEKGREGQCDHNVVHETVDGISLCWLHARAHVAVMLQLSTAATCRCTHANTHVAGADWCLFSKEMYHKLEVESKPMPFDSKAFLQWAQSHARED